MSSSLNRVVFNTSTSRNIVSPYNNLAIQNISFCRFMEHYSSCIFLHSVLFFYYIT
nr:MAG TPA: hypothetical protein [Caudoviricetes sp.]